ncbi:TolC family protein [Estrella lausannensis]|uniref:Outer membrane protein n=1 Tax=Estrella lausannensis TaxID=483423 RepID=A0A0H5DS99_9BACT|nr:TolC family protein [Estrella lausannensis]CRX38614.1 Outer membrane protein [Estrella lausannensis]
MRYLLILLALLTSCGPSKCHIQSPEITEDWKEEPPENAVCGAKEAFCCLEDKELIELIGQALDYNKSLDIAFYTLLEAKALVGVAKGPLFPSLVFNPQGVKQESLINAQGIVAAEPLRTIQTDYTFPLSASYELDLFGKWKSAYLSSVHNVKAKRAAYRGALLLVASSTAENYYILRSLDAEIDVLIKSIDILREALEINEARYEAGLVPYTDVARAKTELANVQSDMENTKRLRQLAENSLAVHLGQNPSLYAKAYDPLFLTPPAVTPPSPGQLLAIRPDMAEKEEEIHRQMEDANVAFADLFPAIALTGSFGYDSYSLSHLLDWKARFWSFAIGLTETVFDAGSKESEWEAAKARLWISLAAYYNQALIAFRETEDALSEIRLRKSEREYLVEAVAAAQVTLELTNQRYLKGLVSYFDVVDAQRTLLSSRRALVKVQGAEFGALIGLIKATGGGF